MRIKLTQIDNFYGDENGNRPPLEEPSQGAKSQTVPSRPQHSKKSSILGKKGMFPEQPQAVPQDPQSEIYMEKDGLMLDEYRLRKRHSKILTEGGIPRLSPHWGLLREKLPQIIEKSR